MPDGLSRGKCIQELGSMRLHEHYCKKIKPESLDSLIIYSLIDFFLLNSIQVHTSACQRFRQRRLQVSMPRWLRVSVPRQERLLPGRPNGKRVVHAHVQQLARESLFSTQMPHCLCRVGQGQSRTRRYACASRRHQDIITI